METTLGRTGLRVCKDGFGALPIQRTDMRGAVRLLRRARDAGINFFDTARAYTDSEEKLGAAFGGAWGGITLATKTTAKTGAGVREHLETSLRLLKRDCIDVYQFHNPPACPLPGDGSGMYEEAVKAREEGKIRFIGVTAHRRHNAHAAVDSGLYDTVQFPFSYIAMPEDEALVRACAAANVGFIAMKALSGGLITDVTASRAWLAQFPNAVPIWGIQREEELDALLAAMADPGVLSPEQRAAIERDKRELSDRFCRGCGYCLPCPAGIEIFSCARTTLLMKRSPADFYSPEWRGKMERITECQNCGGCVTRCPYGLDTPALLRANYEEWKSKMPGSQ